MNTVGCPRCSRRSPDSPILIARLIVQALLRRMHTLDPPTVVKRLRGACHIPGGAGSAFTATCTGLRRLPPGAEAKIRPGEPLACHAVLRTVREAQQVHQLRSRWAIAAKRVWLEAGCKWEGIIARLRGNAGPERFPPSLQHLPTYILLRLLDIHRENTITYTAIDVPNIRAFVCFDIFRDHRCANLKGSRLTARRKRKRSRYRLAAAV